MTVNVKHLNHLHDVRSLAKTLDTGITVTLEMYGQHRVIEINGDTNVGLIIESVLATSLPVTTIKYD